MNQCDDGIDAGDRPVTTDGVADRPFRRARQRIARFDRRASVLRIVEVLQRRLVPGDRRAQRDEMGGPDGQAGFQAVEAFVADHVQEVGRASGGESVWLYGVSSV